MSANNNDKAPLSGAGGADIKEQPINEDAQEQYDRQIRLWGEDVQKRMSGSCALFSGVNGVVAETCKNLLLAGLSATLQDGAVVSPSDLGANFLLDDEDVGVNRAKASGKNAAALNRLVTVSVETRPLEDLPDEFFQSFRMVILSGASPAQQRRISKLCRKFGVGAFYTIETFGTDGFVFSDLGERHMFRAEAGQIVKDPEPMEFPTLEEAFAVRWVSLTDRWGLPPKPFVISRLIALFHEKFGRRPQPSDADAFAALAEGALAENGMPPDFLGGAEGAKRICAIALAEISPSCAILAGVIGQEMIKAISGKGEPACNCISLSGMDGKAKIIRCPKAKPKSDCGLPEDCVPTECL